MKINYCSGQGHILLKNPSLQICGAQSSVFCKCIVACYRCFPFGDLCCVHSRRGPEGVLKQVPLLAECHSCKIRLPLYHFLTNDSALQFYERCHFPVSARCWWCYLSKRIKSLPLSSHHHIVYTILSAFIATSERQVRHYIQTKNFNCADIWQKAQGLHLVRRHMHSCSTKLMLSSRENLYSQKHGLSICVHSVSEKAQYLLLKPTKQ